MDSAKYIIVEMLSGGVMMETPIIFPTYIGHADMVQGLRGLRPDDVLSAGTVDFGTDDNGFAVAMAYGKSESLKAESRSTDSRFITKALGLGDPYEW